MMRQQSRLLNASESCQRGGFHLHMVRRQVEQNTEILTGPSTTPTSDRPWLARRTVANPKTGLERPRWSKELRPERLHQRAELDGRRDLTAVPPKRRPTATTRLAETSTETFQQAENNSCSTPRSTSNTRHVTKPSTGSLRSVLATKNSQKRKSQYFSVTTDFGPHRDLQNENSAVYAIEFGNKRQPQRTGNRTRAGTGHPTPSRTVGWTCAGTADLRRVYTELTEP